jgi:hypothetical protein
MGPRPMDAPAAEDERLRLAIRLTPGAEAAPSRLVGVTGIWQVYSEQTHHYETLLEPTRANTAALLATGFPWDQPARDLARAHAVPAEEVAHLQAAIEATHRRERARA